LSKAGAVLIFWYFFIKKKVRTKTLNSYFVPIICGTFAFFTMGQAAIVGSHAFVLLPFRVFIPRPKGS
jgi:hypothetical protein